MKLADSIMYTRGETENRIRLLMAISRLSRRHGLTLDGPNAEFTHEQVAAEARRPVDLYLREDLGYLLSIRLIEGEAGEETPWGGHPVPATVRITRRGIQATFDDYARYSAKPLDPGEEAGVAEVVRVLGTPDSDRYPRAELETMDETQRDRLANIQSNLAGILVYSARDEAARQLKALRDLLREAKVEGGDPQRTMRHWLTRLSDSGRPLIRPLSQKQAEALGLTEADWGGLRVREHDGAPGSA